MMNETPPKLNMREIPKDKVPEGWSQVPQLSDLKQDFQDARPYHDAQAAKLKTYSDNLNVTGSVKIKKRKSFSSVQPKLIRKHAEWRYPALSEPFLSVENMFKLKPRTASDVQAAKQNELVLNYQWNNIINKRAFVDEMVRANVDEGTIFARVGWVSEEEEYEEEVPIFEYYPATTQEQVEELRITAELKQKDPYAFKQHIEEHIQEALTLTENQGQPIYPVLTETVLVSKTRFLRNQPTVEVVELSNLSVDPLCKGDLDKAEFIVYSFETNKAELRRNSSYFNIDKINIDNNSILAADDHNFGEADTFNFKDDPRTKFVAYEYWGYRDVDGSGVTVPFVATWVNNTLVRMEANPYPDGGLPFVSAQYLPVRKDTYGEPDGELLKDNQKIIGAVTRGAIDLMARGANGQKGMRQDALDAVNKAKYDNGDDYEFNSMVDPRQAIIEHKYSEIPNSVPYMLGAQETDANNMTGVRPFGATDSSAGTATADRGVLDAATKRETAILRRHVDLMREIAKKIVAMNGEFLSDEEIIRVTDEEFVAIRREDLAGQFDLEITISTAEADEAKAKELAFMLQTLGNNVPFDVTKIILEEIATLRKMPHLAKRIEDFVPQPDPVEQEKQNLEVAKLRFEVAELQAKTQKLQTAAALDMAKAAELGSSKDLKDLEFLDKESGKAHAQNLEQDQAQAKGNMALEILKADLQPETVSE